MPDHSPEALEAFVARAPQPHQSLLRELLGLLQREFPQLEASIAWNVPHFRLGKDYVLGVDVLKKALWLHPWSEEILRNIEPALEGYHTTKRSFQLPIDHPLNVDLVREVVAMRLAELGDE